MIGEAAEGQQGENESSEEDVGAPGHDARMIPAPCLSECQRLSERSLRPGWSMTTRPPIWSRP
jgi:hypothetical protein